ncbi:hypothetical protein ACIBG8_14515 [Nonomuraea sp. NPDC050556]|uniref:hypothetical protein n=1 Tax=Nonomuraea sp. NPDC050556 TaxID=3364369 RepID=UPI0037AD4DFD
MALTEIERAEGFFLTGVSADVEEVYLGTHQCSVGPHHIAFDDNFSDPVVMRAFYDPDAYPTTPSNLIVGYIQFVQVLILGEPIPPGVFNEWWKSRTPYATKVRPSDRIKDKALDQTFVDFMDPWHANAIPLPWYALNGYMRNGVWPTPENYFAHPRPNGSLYRVAGRTGLSQVASIVSGVTADLMNASDVAAMIEGVKPLCEIPTLTGETREAYRIAIDHLTDNAVESDDPEDAPLLDGVDVTQMAAKVVGEFVLLTIPDAEDADEKFGPTLVIRFHSVSGSRKVVVHLVSEHDMTTTYAAVATQALWRIFEYLRDENKLADRHWKAALDARGRGRGGLERDPFKLKPSDLAVELKHTTMAVSSSGRTTRDAKVLSGFTWSAMLRYSDDTSLLECAAIRKPKLLEGFNLQLGLDAYLAARTTTKIDYPVDVSNFTMAAMRRENFAAGTKVNYL